jgi:hypothetical protein
VITIDILHMIDRLETLVNNSWRIPLTANRVIQEDAFLDIIDQMRASIPEEVRQAKRTEAERDRLLAQAKEEADRIVGMAREQIDVLISDSEVVKISKKKAEELVVDSRRKAQEVQGGADQYVADVLGGLEEQLLMLLTTVRNGLRQVNASQPGPAATDDATGRQPVQDRESF